MQLEELQRERLHRARQITRWQRLHRDSIALFEQCPVAMAVLAEDFRIERINDRALELLSHRRGALIESTLPASLADDSVLDFHRAARQLAKSGGGERRLRCTFERGDADRVSIDLTLSTIDFPESRDDDDWPRTLVVMRRTRAARRPLDATLGRASVRLQSLLAPEVTLRLEAGAGCGSPRPAARLVDDLLDSLAERASRLLPDGGRLDLATDRPDDRELLVLRASYSATAPGTGVRRTPSVLGLADLGERLDALEGWFLAGSDIDQVRFEIYLPLAPGPEGSEHEAPERGD
jgi:hypothetical protein